MPPALPTIVRVCAFVLFCSGIRADELKLEDAIRLALRNNHEVANAELDVRKARERMAQLRTRLLPSLTFYGLGTQQLRPIDFTFDRGLLGVYPNIGPVPDRDIRVSTPLRPTAFLFGRVVQPLSPIYRIRLNLKTLESLSLLAQEQVRVERQDLVRNVKRLYYGIQQVVTARFAAAETARLYQELERVTATYLSRQVVLRSKYLEVQTRLARAEETELSLQSREASLKEQLNQLLGRDVLIDFTVAAATEVPDIETDAAAARRRALQSRPEIRQARLRIEVAGEDVRAKRAEYIPDLAAEFNSVTLVNFNRFLPVQTNSVGLSVTWEVFDWGRKKSELREKQQTVEQAKYKALDAERLIVIDVNEKLRALQQSRARLRTARLSRETSLENLRVVKDRFQAQASLMKDVLQAQAQLEQANSDLAQATLGFSTAKAEFERATGEDQ